jgi:KipI family sensor histidine kinase inhibitor
MSVDETATRPRILSAGDQAIVVEFGTTISPAVHDRLIMLDQTLRDHPIAGVLETVPTYRSLLIRYDPARIRAAALGERVTALCAGSGTTVTRRRLWHVPVLYGRQAGLDFEDLARMKGLTSTELVVAFQSVDYRVYMLGFSPGFTYLGGLPETLHTPRLATPRQLTPAGGIAIGGAQACVGALPSPSGWRFLGCTPLRSYDPRRAEPFIFQAGDLVRFFEVTESEATALDAQSKNAGICAESEWIRNG